MIIMFLKYNYKIKKDDIFYKQIAYKNYKRLSWLAYFITVISMFHYLMDIKNFKLIHTTFLLISILFVILVNIKRPRKIKDINKYHSFLTYLFVTFILVMGVLKTYLTLQQREFIGLFIMFIVAIPIIFILRAFFYIILSLLSVISLYILSYHYNKASFDIFYKNIVLFIILIIVSSIISIIIYNLKIKNHLIDRMNIDLKNNKNRLELALSGGKIGLWHYNIKTEELDFDDSWYNMLGYQRYELKGNIETWKTLVHPDDFKKMTTALEKHIDNESECYEIEHRLKNKDGKWQWILISGKINKRDKYGQPMVMNGIYKDITERKEREINIALSEEKHRKIFEKFVDVYFETYLDGTIKTVSPSVETVLGYNNEELIGKSILDVYYNNKDRIDFLKEMKKEGYIRNYELKLLKENNKVIDVLINANYVYGNNNNPQFISGIMRDVTKRKDIERKLKEYATYDDLTKVYNRRMGLVMLEEKINEAERENRLLTVCFLDVNGLKEINDNIGHKAGDDLLKIVAKVIDNEIRKIDIICRMGGDEFLIIFSNCSIRQAEHIWKRIVKEYNRINKVKNYPFMISVSHGLSEYKPKDKKSIDELINIADKRMYKEKKILKDKLIDKKVRIINN
ncbi:MAG: diguanylate cyclase [Firmicutes bacterium]|nr:diguanylate cyclase [Bacillota bacterium]